MGKLITFVVPCYNSEGYLRKCVESLLPAKENCEIIIVNDGSTDRTGEIADGYAASAPDCVRVLHQPNGGLTSRSWTRTIGSTATRWRG